MNHIKRVSILFSFFALIAFTRAAGLQVQGNVGKLIPVAIKGYQGEVAKVLAFDLEVMGCKMVPEGDASYVLDGKNGPANLTGILRDNAGNFGFNLNINGAAPRVLAHALSNATIKAITGQDGIAHTHILFTMNTFVCFVSSFSTKPTSCNLPSRLASSANSCNFFSVYPALTIYKVRSANLLIRKVSATNIDGAVSTIT